MQISPEEVRIGHGDGNQVSPINGNSWTFLWGRLAHALFVPASNANFPKGKRLQRGGLARIVRTNENNGFGKLNVYVVKLLEVPNSQSGQHVYTLS